MVLLDRDIDGLGPGYYGIEKKPKIHISKV